MRVRANTLSFSLSSVEFVRFVAEFPQPVVPLTLSTRSTAESESPNASQEFFPKQPIIAQTDIVLIQNVLRRIPTAESDDLA